MRVVAGVAALLLLGGIPALAQNSPPSSSTVLKGLAATVVEGCPVDMRVSQRMGGAMVAADENGISRKVFAQKLRLILNSLRDEDGGRKAVSAIVTVHGTGAKAQARDLRSGADNNAMVRTFTVDLAHWGEPGVSGDFMLPGYTSATRVDLESVTYEDGSTWKLSSNENCRVAPDPFMLIRK